MTRRIWPLNGYERGPQESGKALYDLVAGDYPEFLKAVIELERDGYLVKEFHAGRPTQKRQHTLVRVYGNPAPNSVQAEVDLENPQT